MHLRRDIILVYGFSWGEAPQMHRGLSSGHWKNPHDKTLIMVLEMQSANNFLHGNLVQNRFSFYNVFKGVVMAKKEKDIFKEIGDQLKEIGEDLKTELEKGEKKIKSFEKAVQPSLHDLGEKFKELGKVISGPAGDFSQRFKEWSDSVKPVVKDMKGRAKDWKQKEKEKREADSKP